ncbi:recombinase family protein [Streptomyces tsukubensis]|uniref:recombinase family protein n=1 Tax=Streptomyces tsukubensis TaxID=83656 RepID=UPI00344E6EF6
MPPTPITSNTFDLSGLSSVDDPLIAQLRRRGRSTVLDIASGYASYTPQRPGAYLRLSLDDINEERRAKKKESNRKTAFERQSEDVEAKRKTLGWGPFAEVYEDPETSAYKKRKITRPDGAVDWVVLRPGFQRMLSDLLNGVIDGVIFYDLDRLVRQPRDLEDLANVVQETKRPAVGATSELNLVREADCNMARVMCVMLLKQSQDTARRVARDTLGAAESGILIGRIGYGWVRKGPDAGRSIASEAEIIKRIFMEYLQGGSATSIARGLNEDGIPSPGGKKWDDPTIKVMITNPRYAGMALYQGVHRIEKSQQHNGPSKLLTDDKGNPLMGQWDAIITPQDWFKVQSAMQQRREASGVDTTNYGGRERGKYLLSGLVRCAKCETPMEGHTDKRRDRKSYRCPTRGRSGACGSTSRAMQPLDDLVDLLMLTYIQRELSSLPHDDEKERQEIIRRSQELEEQEQEQAREKERIESKWQAGKLAELGWTEDDYDAHIGRISRNLREITEKTAALKTIPERESTEDLVERWSNGGIKERRSIMKRYTMGFQLLPVGRGARTLAPESVVPLWRDQRITTGLPDQRTGAGHEDTSALQD